MSGLTVGARVRVTDIERRTRVGYVGSITSHHIMLHDGFGLDEGMWQWARIIQLEVNPQ